MKLTPHSLCQHVSSALPVHQSLSQHTQVSENRMLTNNGKGGPSFYSPLEFLPVHFLFLLFSLLVCVYQPLRVCSQHQHNWSECGSGGHFDFVPLIVNFLFCFYNLFASFVFIFIARCQTLLLPLPLQQCLIPLPSPTTPC